MRVDRHAADGIGDTLRSLVVMVVMFWCHRSNPLPKIPLGGI
jgi:hypothetical protein